MLVAQQNKKTTQTWKAHPFINRSNSVNYRTPDPKAEICSKQKGKLKYKQSLVPDVIAALLSSDKPVMRAQAERIRRCCSDDNLFVGVDFHTSDGELFDGKGSLWACNSRLCPNCVGKLGSRHRKQIRYVMENQKLMVGENWYSPTFTMPNLNLVGQSASLIGQIHQCAWRRFCSMETRTNKRKTWFQKTIRGGFKNCEFTYTENSVYHYHTHGLFVAKSSIQRDKFYEIRLHWTKALQFAFKKFNVEWECRTGNKNFIPALYSFLLSKPKMSLFLNARETTKFFGLADVQVVKVDWKNREKTISELCKYVTKNESWSKIPIDQLEAVVAVPRLWRMFESFGVCRQTARQLDKISVEIPENYEHDHQSESTNQGVNSNGDTYMYQNKLNDRRFPSSNLKPRVPWRVRVSEIPFQQYKMELDEEIRYAQRFRRYQLHRRFQFATFQTLDGEVF
jgi:hypothetical protein